MNKFSMAAVAALLVAGIAPAHAADCNAEYRNFFEKLQLNGNGKMSGDRILAISVK